MNRQKNTLTEFQAASLMAACLDGRLSAEKLLVAVIIQTGCRASESLSLSPRDFNFSDNTVKITGVKNSLSGTYPITPQLTKAIKNYITDCAIPTATPLSLWRKPMLTLDSRYRRLERAFKLLCMVSLNTTDLTLHSCRRRVGQLVYSKTNFDLMAARAVLRHRSVTSTQHYLTHVNLSDVVEIVKDSNELLKK